ncbi:MAG TPA: DapH/DapD/GlmU-related protein [Capsulimonadaceae bacterium]|nr:DapH/DapD/GlmU-related protein [Capsulimonadaceae bacterium]
MAKGVWELFRQDASRWVIQGTPTPASQVTFGRALALLYRYRALRATMLFRIGGWCQRKGVPLAPGIIQRRIASVYGLEIEIGAQIGGGLYLAHPIGTVIAAKSIGENCSMISCVTIGMRNEWAFPTIGDNVFLGAGARVLGGLTVGDNAVIGANAVVIDDIPAGATAVGIPAKVVR